MMVNATSNKRFEMLICLIVIESVTLCASSGSELFSTKEQYNHHKALHSKAVKVDPFSYYNHMLLMSLIPVQLCCPKW